MTFQNSCKGQRSSIWVAAHPGLSPHGSTTGVRPSAHSVTPTKLEIAQKWRFQAGNETVCELKLLQLPGHMHCLICSPPSLSLIVIKLLWWALTPGKASVQTQLPSLLIFFSSFLLFFQLLSLCFFTPLNLTTSNSRPIVHKGTKEKIISYQNCEMSHCSHSPAISPLSSLQSCSWKGLPFLPEIRSKCSASQADHPTAPASRYRSRSSGKVHQATANTGACTHTPGTKQ